MSATAAERLSITLVTPSFNQGDVLEDAIQSVLRQDYPNLEYFVMDGGSRDGSVDVIRRYADRLTAWRSGPDGGQAAAIQSGLEQGTGEICGWVNSDDMLMPGALDAVAAVFAAQPEVVLVYGDCIVVDRAGGNERRVRVPDFDRGVLERRDFIWQPAAFFRRSALEAVGGVNPGYNWVMDWDLWLRLTRHGRAAHIDRPLATARVYAENKSETGGSRRRAEILRLLWRHRAFNPALLFQASAFAALKIEETTRRRPRLQALVFGRLRPFWKILHRSLSRAAGVRGRTR